MTLDDSKIQDYWPATGGNPTEPIRAWSKIAAQNWNSAVSPSARDVSSVESFEI